HPSGRGPREAARRRHSFAGRVHAFLGDLRPPDRGAPEQRVATERDGPRRRRGSLHLGVGAVWRSHRSYQRPDKPRGVWAAQGDAEEVRVRTGPGGCGRKATTGQEVTKIGVVRNFFSERPSEKRYR